MSNTGDGDKRKVSTDALETLGKIITPLEKRDAIHLAVIPAEAAHALRPGDHVLLDEGNMAYLAETGEGIGIVDPFLLGAIKKGEHFWLVIYPRVITSLRHVWTHPSIPDEAGTPAASVVVIKPPPLTEAQLSEAWIRNYCLTSLPISYDVLMAGADDWVRSTNKEGSHRDYLVLGGLLENEYVSNEFWPHYDNVRGVTTQEHQRQSFFSCSC